MFKNFLQEKAVEATKQETLNPYYFKSNVVMRIKKSITRSTEGTWTREKEGGTNKAREARGSRNRRHGKWKHYILHQPSK
jgi:hypothetical protein